jgi:XapX domain-containing protein
MLIKVALGLLLGFGVGFFCAWIGIPSPAPPVLPGALVVLAMTVGYVAVGRVASWREYTTKQLCGGPSGRPPSDDRGTS